MAQYQKPLNCSVNEKFKFRDCPFSCLTATNLPLKVSKTMLKDSITMQKVKLAKFFLKICIGYEFDSRVA